MRAWTMLITLILLLGTLPVLVTCATKAPEEPGQEAGKGEIVIGILEDLSGPMAGVGSDTRDGELDAMRYINEEKGGIDGHQLRSTVVDHKFDTTIILAGWDRLENEGALVIMSVLGALPALSNLAEKNKTILLAQSGASMDQLFPREPRYLFSQGAHLPGTVFSACRMIEKDWKEKGEKGTPKVGFDFASIGTQKTLLTKAAEMDMEKRGWEYAITYTSIAAADVTTQVLKLKDFGCDYIYSAGSESATVLWIKELERQNFHPIFYGVTNLGSQEIWNATGELCVGTRPYRNAPQWIETDFPLVNQLHELNAKWYPEVTTRSGNYVRGFAAITVLAEALGKAISSAGYANLNGDIMKDSMETIRDFDPGINIGYTWTANDHQGLHGIRWYERRADGELTPLMSEWDVFPPLPDEQRTDAFWMQD